MAKGGGSGKTPERVVELLKIAVAEKGQSAVARETGLTQSAVHRYISGIGEPSTETFEKLSVYFDRSVSFLRGEAKYDERRFSQKDWDETRGGFESLFKELKDLLELYSLSPDHLKETVVTCMDGIMNNFIGITEQYGCEFSENNIVEIKNVMVEAVKILDKHHFDTTCY